LDSTAQKESLFGGSGSTGIACDETNRNGICFELNSEISIASKERGEKRKRFNRRNFV